MCSAFPILHQNGAKGNKIVSIKSTTLAGSQRSAAEAILGSYVYNIYRYCEIKDRIEDIEAKRSTGGVGSVAWKDKEEAKYKKGSRNIAGNEWYVEAGIEIDELKEELWDVCYEIVKGNKFIQSLGEDDLELAVMFYEWRMSQNEIADQLYLDRSNVSRRRVKLLDCYKGTRANREFLAEVASMASIS